MAEESPELELPRAVALAWGVAANPQRGPKREMSIERIVDVAMRLADAGGLASVSMAAVAAELGFTPMSLYRYVSAKDDLVLLMQEGGIGLPSERVREADGWRAGLRQLAEEQLQAYLDHPWLLDIPVSGVPVTPNSIAWVDVALEVLAPVPLSSDDKISIVLAIGAQARWGGSIRRDRSLGDVSDGDRSDRDRSDRGSDGWDDRLARSLVTAEEFPAMAAALRDGGFASGVDLFAFARERVLDGVDAFLAGRAPVVVAATVDPREVAASRDQKYKEAVKARREVEKKLHEARKRERELLKAAVERLAR